MSPYYTRYRGRIEGPFAVDELHKRAQRKMFSRLHEVSTDQEAWSSASEHAELFPARAERKVRKPKRKGVAIQESGVQAAAPPGNEVVVEVDVSNEAWFYARGEDDIGPLPFKDLKALADDGELEQGTLVWNADFDDWVEASSIAGLFSRARSRRRKRNSAVETASLAVPSFICGILGATILPVLCSIPAIILGHLALKQIRDSQDSLAGYGLSVAGLILGYFIVCAAFVAGIVLGILALVT